MNKIILEGSVYTVLLEHLKNHTTLNLLQNLSYYDLRNVMPYCSTFEENSIEEAV